MWEWPSETYVMKQQGHFNMMNAVDFSPDGRHLVTGGEDGKVMYHKHSKYYYKVVLQALVSCPFAG